VTFDEAKSRLIDLARTNGGTLTAEMVERDRDFTDDAEIVSAAAHALAGSTNVFSSGRDTGWFPYSEIRFSDLR
jgi:hypothetical protein